MHFYPTKPLPRLPKGVTSDKYKGCDMQPLFVQAKLNTGYIPYDSKGACALDSMLAYAFSIAFHKFMGLSKSKQVHVFPLPVACLWQDKQGLPLWGTGDLLPIGDFYESNDYLHRRFPQQRAPYGKKLNVNQAAGRYKSMRTFHRVISTDSVGTVCIGDKAEIEKLLAFIPAIGKRINIGFGAISSWDVSVMDISLDDALNRVLTSRPIPIDYYETLPSSKLALRGWTPPYWHRMWHQECVIP